MTDKEYIRRLKEEIQSLKELCITLNHKCNKCEHTYKPKELRDEIKK